MPMPNPLLSRPLTAADTSTLRAFERRFRLLTTPGARWRRKCRQLLANQSPTLSLPV